MDSCNEQDIPSITPEDLVSIPAVHVGISAEVLSPALPTGHSRKPNDLISPSPAGTLKSSRGSAGGYVDEEEINVMPPSPSLIHFVLANFALAMLLISLTIFVVFFFAVAWLTVLRDARSMRDQASGLRSFLMRPV